MPTKKQETMLKDAIFFIENELIEGGQRSWGSFFEDNENNTNALIIGLMDHMEGRPDFCKAVIKQEKYMPAKLVRYARIYAEKVNPLIKNLIDNIELLDTDAESLLNEIDKIKLFNRDIGKEWDRLEHYYFEPFADSLQKVIEAYVELDTQNLT